MDAIETAFDKSKRNDEECAMDGCPEKIRVLPVTKILTGGGYIWEWELSDKGWNELSGEDKVGEIVGLYELEGGSIVCDVRWPKLNIISKNIFMGELKKVEGITKKE